MKIKLMVSEANFSAIASELSKLGVELDDNAELILSERNTYVQHLIGKQNDELFRLKTEEITHIESFAHDVIAHANGGEFKIAERLKILESILDPAKFLRISNSVIVSANHIQSIKPALSQKFILTLTDGTKVDVTRSYYYIFKEFFGI